MQIQWFPGHMHKAQLQIREALPNVDLFIELLDARIPFSSQNPMLATLRGKKPCLKLLSKSDLADPVWTSQWQTHLEQQSSVKARAVTTLQPGKIARLTDLCHKMLPHRHGLGRPLRTMIVGIPNVGKSTLINILAGRKIAKAGNEPAITKSQQQIGIGKGIVLLDTPGVLWPNVENENSGYRLAATGAIKDTAMEYPDVAYFVAGYLLKEYHEALVTRYALDAMPVDQIALLDAIGKKRGCLAKGGIVDYDRTSRIFINDLRAGALGPITFETPELVAQETAAQKATKVKKVERQQARKKARRSDNKARRKGRK
ncbi:MAG TPA: ribosome biogenesis GTPase YlqF [Pirellulaceae bacterium]|jgi:ribosome biogenesis GTPase A|nr:ribosome biogenesis GTPase YlqF [Pirellulaceae bacterium]